MLKIKQLLIFIFLFLFACRFTNCVAQNPTDILDPVVLKPYMFQTQITGFLKMFVPNKKVMSDEGKIIQQEYEIEMVKTKQQILPKALFNQTTIYAYNGSTKSGYVASFPAPVILATKDVPIQIKWRNNISGPHIFNVDLNYPFSPSIVFQKEVPTVTHVHGVVTNQSSDGLSQAYYSKNGAKGPLYKTQEQCEANEAIFRYPNEQQSGNHWYHDHAFGITRLNVYAGLAGFYKIFDPNNQRQIDIVNSHSNYVKEGKTRYLIITDKTFRNNGELYYPNYTLNSHFTSWVPEFYGNTILVNGVLWPKMTLRKGENRFVVLNACNGRYLNIQFRIVSNSSTNPISIQVIRVDGSYYNSQLYMTSLLIKPSSRVEFIVDFSQYDDQIQMTNSAAAPYPNGMNSTLTEFTRQILRINLSGQVSTQNDMDNYMSPKTNMTRDLTIQINRTFPAFGPGETKVITLFEVTTVNGFIDAMFIDGQTMQRSMKCESNPYYINKTYDFHIVNLTPDTHPFHIHLVNMQKVKQYLINTTQYQTEYFKANGEKPKKNGFPNQLRIINPQNFKFKTNSQISITDYQKIFTDTVDIAPNSVTVVRLKFSKVDGTRWNSFNLTKQKFLMHCHILQHQDNQMMVYFCLDDQPNLTKNKSHLSIFMEIFMLLVIMMTF